MTILQAALMALYPTLIVLCLVVAARYARVLNDLSGATRSLVCSLLLMLATLLGEQVYYGLGRVNGTWAVLNNYTPIVVLMKTGYVAALLYMVYALHELAPASINKNLAVVWVVALWFVSFISFLW